MCPQMSIVEYAEYFGNVYTNRFVGCSTHECLMDRYDKAIEVLTSDDTLVLLYEHLKTDKKIWHSKALSLKYEALRTERAALTYTQNGFGNTLEVLSLFLGENDVSSLLPSEDELSDTWLDGPRYGVGIDLMENCFTDESLIRRKHTWKCDATSYGSAKALCEWIGDECKFFVQWRSSNTSEDVETCGSHMTDGDCYYMCYQPIRTTHGGNMKTCSFVRSTDLGGGTDLYDGAASPQVAADGTDAPTPGQYPVRSTEGQYKATCRDSSICGFTSECIHGSSTVSTFTMTSLPDSAQSYNSLSTTCCDFSGTGRLLSSPDCRPDATWEQAAGFCASLGLRLCSEDELLAGVGNDMGCNADKGLSWTNTSCLLEATATTPALALPRVQADALRPFGHNVTGSGTSDARRLRMEKRTLRATSEPYTITPAQREALQETLKIDIELYNNLSRILLVPGGDTTCPGGCTD